MVDPSARRRDIATALLDSAAEQGVQRGLREGLLVVPGTSVAGRGLAVHRGGVHEHSEHALVLLEAPSPAPANPRITVRRAGPADAVVVGRLLQAAFGDPARDLADQLATEQEQTLLVAVDSEAVGTVRLTLRELPAACTGLPSTRHGRARASAAMSCAGFVLSYARKGQPGWAWRSRWITTAPSGYIPRSGSPQSPPRTTTCCR